MSAPTMAPPQVVAVDAQALKAAAAWAARTLPTRPTVAVMAGMVLAAGEGVLRMEAFDYETYATVEVDGAAGAFDGPVLVSGRMFAEATARLTGEVTLTVDGPGLTVRAGRQTFRLHLMDHTHYPQPPRAVDPAGQVDAEDLHDLVGQAAVAAAKVKENDLNLHALKVIAQAGHLTAMGTNRYMAARVRTPWDGQDFAALVPAATLTGALRGMTGQVALGANATHLTVAADDRAVTISLVAGDYAQIERVLDGTVFADQACHVDRSDLVAAVGAARVTLVRGGQPLALVFTPGQIEVTGPGDQAESEALLDAEGDADTTHHVAPEFFADLIGAAPGPRVHITPGVGPNRPFLIRGATTEGEPIESCTYVLVPINLAARR